MVVPQWTASFYLVLVVFLPRLTQQDTRQKRDIGQLQPRILTHEGHLIFQTGANHNITFRSGGDVNVDGQSLKELAAVVKSNQQTITRLNSQIASLNTKVTSNKQNISRLENRVAELERIGGATVSPDLVHAAQLREVQSRLSSVEGQVRTLTTTHAINECLSNPCRNGATCEDKYNGFNCRCFQGWRGSLCGTDVNECAEYAGTDRGCQNGATCRNLHGNFRCDCTANWAGSLCASPASSDCTSPDICGHGTCVNLPRTHSGQAKYKCICEAGYKNTAANPACVQDIDECTESKRPPCSQNPLVACINLPGTFHCGACPPGYNGPGYACTDIDECSSNNGGCSVNPRVDCINTIGSFRCGPCPPGYQNNGRLCQYVGVCHILNGGCHPLAACREGLNQATMTCTCPVGYVGSGFGSGGCIMTPNLCSHNPCQHGQCRVSGNAYSCACDAGYTGSRCTINVNECSSQPCQNGGTCTDLVNGYTCMCTTAATGPNCERLTQDCGGSLTGTSGRFQTPGYPNSYPHGLNCSWYITVPQGSIIRLTFHAFDIEIDGRDLSSCPYDYVEIFDNSASTSTGGSLGRFCGSTTPPVRTSVENVMTVVFRSDLSSSESGFQASYVALTADNTCGKEYIDENEGVIESPNYPADYPHDRQCIWTIKVPTGMQIRLNVTDFLMENHTNCRFDYLDIRNGGDPSSPLVGRYCGGEIDTLIRSHSNRMYLKMKTDRSQSARGFKILFDATSTGCGGDMTAASGDIISPNYPVAYTHRAECYWTITIARGNSIRLTFVEFDIESHASCVYDYLEIREGSSTGKSYGRFCGTSKPQLVRTQGNKMWLKFRSDANTAGRGFHISYRTGNCNWRITLYR